MKKLILAAALLAALPVFAQSTSGSGSESRAETANSLSNVGSPVINMPAGPGYVHQRIDSNQAATAATVFVNPPSADTCAKAGVGVSAQLAGGGFSISNGGDESASCETRADAINMKVIGTHPDVIKARQCQSPLMAQAFEDAGQPCPQRLRPQSGQPVAQAPQSVNVNNTTDPYISRRLGAR